MSPEVLQQYHHSPLENVDLPDSLDLQKESGKVRDVFVGDEKVVLVATDRISAFDKNIGIVPDRGQVLNQLSKWWFEQTADIIPNHMLAVPDPNVMIAKKCPTVPVEMVVRGYNTGVTNTSIWHRYSRGQREFGGVTLPDGIKRNDPLPEAILDPTTKAVGAHDEEITINQIIEEGILTEEEYQELQDISLSLFTRGQELALKSGLILVDTKYEFGRDIKTGDFVLIDEIHTPDSSRYWDFETYEDRLMAGEEPDNYDKEYARLSLKSIDYNGDGSPPKIPLEIINEVRRRYVEVYERLTGLKFKAQRGDRQKDIPKNIEEWFLANKELEPQRPQKAVIIMGSESDLDHSRKIADVFTELGVDVDLRVGSAHKTPEHVINMLKEYNAANLELAFILVAGRSNALGGFVDFQTISPVISCPPYSEKFGGADIYSSLRMPSGSSGVTVLEPRAAARHVLRIFALNNTKLREKLLEENEDFKSDVTGADSRI